MRFVKGHGFSPSPYVGKASKFCMAAARGVREDRFGDVEIPFRLGTKIVPLCLHQSEK